MASLQDKTNDMHVRLLARFVRPSALVAMTPQDMASAEHKAKLAEMSEYNKSAMRSDLKIGQSRVETDGTQCFVLDAHGTVVCLICLMRAPVAFRLSFPYFVVECLDSAGRVSMCAVQAKQNQILPEADPVVR